MKRQRVTLLVEIDLDPVSGWGDSPLDFESLVKRNLMDSVPHYHPKVRLLDLDVARRTYAILRAHGPADGCVVAQGQLLEGLAS